MAKAFEEQRNAPDLGALSFEERVAIMADREAAERPAFTCSSNGLPMASIRAAIASRTLSRLSSKGSKSTASKSRSPGTVKRRAHTGGEV